VPQGQLQPVSLWSQRMGGTRSAKKKTAPSKKRPRSSHAAL